MNIDTLISVAFGLFIVLLVWRIRERFLERKKEQKTMGDANALWFKNLFYDEKNKTSRMRPLFSIFLLVFLGGAIIYMIYVSIMDFSTFTKSSVLVRSLLFVLAINVFVFNLIGLLKGSNKGDARK